MSTPTKKKEGYVQVSVSIPEAMAYDLRRYADSMCRPQTVVLRRAIELVMDTPWTESVAMLSRERRAGTVSSPSWRAKFEAQADAPRPRIEAPPDGMLTFYQLDKLANLDSRLDPKTGYVWYPLAPLVDLYDASEVDLRAMANSSYNHQITTFDFETWVMGAWLPLLKDCCNMAVPPSELQKIHEGIGDAFLRAQESGRHITGPAVPPGT